MSLQTILLWLITIPHLFITISQSAGPTSPIPGDSYIINCGGGEGTTDTGLKYVSDEGFISAGAAATVKHPDEVLPLLATLRHFPDAAARKHCFSVPAARGAKYLVRTTYFYGGFDGGDAPPVFEQVVDGTRWGVVDTAADYAAGLGSYYEIVVAAAGPELSVCLARSGRTAAAASPFISALEVERLDESVYNATDFGEFALSTVARSSFGGDAEFIGYPDDKFNRIWQAFTDEQYPTVTSHSAVTPSDFWNLPPARAFGTALTTSRGKALRLRWPPAQLPAGEYHVALYFQDNRTPSPFSWRVFDVSVNGRQFYAALNVSASGVAVYSPRWPLAGQTLIALTPVEGAPVGPLINAAEVLQILPLGGKTLARDEMAMMELARSLENRPSDWTGDPCLPKENSWTGVTCSKLQGKFARVVTLNLTGKGLSGTLSQAIANLTALNHIWLGGNKLSGTIPEMWSLKELKTLHLENNQFEGPIPKSLGQLPRLYEIFLQNNKLDGEIPAALRNRNGKTIQV